MESQPNADPNPLYDRELSWLSFNYRVLQEAKDPKVPLLERLKFLAIYSSNLDEFYRVRVASVRSLKSLKKKSKKKLAFSPKKLLAEIYRRVDQQQQEFGHIFRQQLLPALKKEKVCIVNESEVTEAQCAFVRQYFEAHLLPILRYDVVEEMGQTPFLENMRAYLFLRLKPKEGNAAAHVLMALPTDKHSRFLVIPDKEIHTVILLDDVLRLCYDLIFPDREVESGYSVKMSRDAELYIEDEFTGDLVSKIQQSLSNRLTGLPSRFLVDEKMPENQQQYLQRMLNLSSGEIIPGGKYHNFSDYFGFPAPDRDGLTYAAQPPLAHPELDRFSSFFEALSQKDFILHFPYQSYDYVTRFIEEAADDPAVTSIKITLYRVASDSKVAKALIRAAQNGKKVEVFDEIKARFDEQSNLFWGNELAQAGAKVRYSYPDLKVHSKICLITRQEAGKKRHYAYLGTGNFNEKTARIYGDHALLTSDAGLCKDMDRVFAFLMDFKLAPKFKKLLVAPFQMRETFEDLIDREIENVRSGGKGQIVAKMNSLEDQEMVNKLYAASQGGVEVKLIIRGICRLIPGIPGLSDNIEVVSIVDRYLEHARIYQFHHNGADEMYIASADWMNRNLSKRVEVGFPINDPALKSEIQDIVQLQLQDNTKARIIDQEQSNAYVRNEKATVQAQQAIYNMLENLVEKPQD
ncbi:MAG: polyphosphate kinase 1 [Salibacteraceae bacterium]